jgi:hypothetical protein
VSSEKSYGRRIAQMATSESRMSALGTRCALMEGLICFFMSRARGTHHLENTLLPRNAKLHQDFLENFFREAMASLICSDKTEAK